MKLKSTVVVLGTAAFINLLIGYTTFASPKVDMAQQATDRSLTAAISKLKSYEQQPAQEALPKTIEPTSTSQIALPAQVQQDPQSQPAPEEVAPVKPKSEAKTPPAPAVNPDTEDVIMLDLTSKNKAIQTAQKKAAALKKRAVAAVKRQDTPALEKQPEVDKPSKHEILDRRRTGLARMALGFRGTPYVWGGDNPRAFDCSGFTQYLYKKHYGIRLPHNAKMQFGIGKSISRAALAIGDLVFFNTRGPLSHVGMYIGNGKFIHAANPRRGVRVDALAGYYTQVYAGARRYR